MVLLRHQAASSRIPDFSPRLKELRRTRSIRIACFTRSSSRDTRIGQAGRS